MNEPSVFDSTENTIPKDALHFLSDGRKIQHKDIHNSYGRFMIEATYEGLKNR